jgi:hypothetical protein
MVFAFNIDLFDPKWKTGENGRARAAGASGTPPPRGD